MTLSIDLDAYARELGAFRDLAGDFLFAESIPIFDRIQRELEIAVDSRRPKFGWATPSDLKFGPSTNYDGPGRSLHEAELLVGFDFRFSRPSNSSRKSTIWEIDDGATHAILKDTTGAFTKLHFDSKTAGAWGPQFHIQTASFAGDMPIPRLVSVAFLPSDCTDLMLAELLNEVWPRHQQENRNSRHVSIVREGQERRLRQAKRDISHQWAASKVVTRLTMLQNYTPGFATIEL